MLQDIQGASVAEMEWTEGRVVAGKFREVKKIQLHPKE